MPSTPDRPCPERPQSEDDLDFTRKKMVRWFSPLEGVRAGTKSVLSALFGAYADWREVQALQAAAEPTPVENTTGGAIQMGAVGEWYDLSEGDSLWFDYTADLGDGFDATYTVARLLAERRLRVDGHETERGRFLVMGGDQVYPTSTRTEYRDRLVGPYRAALPCVTDEEPPLLFAVPGNHDWYDGLTSFLRLFTQRRWIGGWRTQQRRSYFAVKLPHDWWLWGIDVQLASDIDGPQLEYFRSIAADGSIMPSGSKIVLCTPEPSWLYAETKGREAYRNLGYLIDDVIAAHGHEMKVGLAGDLHMYARYAEAETDRQRFIAGGGGAYLYPTHDLPETLNVETPRGRKHRFTMRREHDDASGESVFPDRSTSRRLSWGALLLPFKNYSFAGFVAVLYLFFAYLAQSATVIPVLETPEHPSPVDGPFVSLLEMMAASRSLGEIVETVGVLIKHAPGAMLWVVVLWLGLGAFADLKRGVSKMVLGGIHAGVHLLLAITLMWGFAVWNLGSWELDVNSLWHVAVFTVEMLVVGGVLGGVLTGLYLLLANRLFRMVGVAGVHANELFSCQHIPHYKNVLRFHVGEEGNLTLYPLGISTVETNWTLRPEGTLQEPWFEGEGDLADRVELIEGPVDV